MCTASCMYRRTRRLAIRWSKKVGPPSPHSRLGWEKIADVVLDGIVKQLTDLLNQVKDEQSYIVMRERTHRNTAESTNGRVKWWSIFQLGVLIGEGVFQVWWLKRFFEVRG